MDDFQVNIADIPLTDIVFRVMTWEHVPSDLSKSAKAKDVVAATLDDDEEEIIHTEYDDEEVKPTKYIKVNFPPFVHYKIDNDPI